MDDDRQDSQTRRPTLSQVARAAGVSEITASRALRRVGTPTGCRPLNCALRPAQELKTQYDEEYESVYSSAENTRDKKSVYTTIVVGLVVVAFVAPMIQFFYFTGGD